MKPSQLPWKWLLVGLLAVLVFAIALIPWLIGDTSRFGDRVASELSAWTGGEVKFIGPVRVRFLPDVSVRGQLEVQDSTKLPAVQTLTVREAKVSLDLVDLLRGRITIDALRLLKPRVTLRDTLLAGASAATPAQDLFTSLLGGAPVRVLHVRNGRIALLAGKRIAHSERRGGEFSTRAHALLQASPREIERHGVLCGRVQARRRHAGRDRRRAQVSQLARRQAAARRQLEGILGVRRVPSCRTGAHLRRRNLHARRQQGRRPACAQRERVAPAR